MQNWLFVLAVSVSLASNVFGQLPRAAPSRVATLPAAVDPRIKTPLDHLDLKDGDTIVFLGDSITHQCGYTQYIEDFYYTRFPKTRILFHNAGVGGDRVFHAIDRFDSDVAAYKPKYVTVMFGGNDAKDKQWDAALFEKYAADMHALLDKIEAIGATPIVMGPAMFDRRALLIKPSPARPYDGEAPKYTNAVMGYYSAFMRDQAGERGLIYADVFSAQNNFCVEQRFHNPNYKISNDGWHPLPDGEVIIAATFLDAVHGPREVSRTIARLDAKGWDVTVTPDAKVSEISGDATHLRFISQESALPWVLPAEAQLGYKISSAGDHHSAEPLQVQGLSAGNYELKIDGTTIGVFSSSLLACGIELQNFDKTPQYQQALAVAVLNQEKNEKAMHPIRNLYRDLKVNRPNHPTPESIAASMNEMRPKVTALEKLKDEYERKIRETAVPKSHKYEFTKVDSK